MAAPHLALPLRVTGRGGFATVEQDSPAELAQNVAVIVMTAVGSRAEVPEFGSPRPEFTGPDLPGITAAVEEWEPRVNLDAGVIAATTDAETVSAVRAVVAPHV